MFKYGQMRPTASQSHCFDEVRRMTVRRKANHASGQILDESGTGLWARTHLNTSLVASWPPVT